MINHECSQRTVETEFTKDVSIDQPEPTPKHNTDMADTFNSSQANQAKPDSLTEETASVVEQIAQGEISEV